MEYKFKVGDPVFKYKGSYKAEGTIRSAFTTSTGDKRYVFEFLAYPGMLHIFNEEQLEEITNKFYTI